MYKKKPICRRGKVNLSLGEWNSQLHKQSPPTRTKRKLMFLTRVGGFRLCRRGF